MPPSHANTAGTGCLRASAVDERFAQQIASSNATASAFLGGRQPSWMNPGATTTRKPTSRPNHSRQPVAQAAQQQGPAVPAVLPSPAPSDEPSPALSTALDSPKANPVSLLDAPTMASASAPTSSTLPVTEARFVIDGADVQGDLRPEGASGNPIPSSEQQNITLSSHSHSQTPAGQSTVDSQIRAPNPGPSLGRHPPQPPSTGNQDGQDRHTTSLSFGQVHSPTVARSPLPPPLKRRRTDQAPFMPFDYSYLLASIEQHVQSCGGDRALEPLVEKPRVLLLRQACREGDGFFIALHQLFSIWSQTPQDAHLVMPLPLAPVTVTRAFTLLETILKKNEFVSPAHQIWFARFPIPVEAFAQRQTEFTTTFRQIAQFLAKLVDEYEPLSLATHNRRYPFLVDELLGRLGCSSPVLQTIFFTACRRRLGVPDGNLGLQIEQAFREDQRNHYDETARGQVFAPISYGGEIEQRNAALIALYKQIVEAAASLRAPTQSGTQSPSLQSPGLRSPPIPSTLSPRTSFQQFVMADQSAFAQNSQQHQATFTTYPMAVSLPSQAVAVPSPVPTLTPNPYAALRGTGGAVTARMGSSNHSHIAQLHRQRPANAPATQYGVLGSNVPNQQPQPHLPDYMAALQAQQTSLQQHAALQAQQHFARQQREWNTYVFENLPVQPGHQVVPQTRHAVTQSPAGVEPFPHALQPTHNIRNIQQMQQMQLQQNRPDQQPTGTRQPSRVAGNGAHVRQPQPTAQQIRRNQPGQAQQTQLQRDAVQRNGAMQAKDPLIPPKGYSIPRPEWPYDLSDRKSLMMSLHQAHVRSPKRVIRDGQTERFYQAVKLLPLKPTPIAPKNTIHEFRFEVTEEQFALAAAKSKTGGGILTVVEHFNGALRWRIRCCIVSNSPKDLTEQQWVVLDVNWPPNIAVTLNDKVLEIRRQAHNGKDLTTEVTDFIVCGTNVLKIGLPDVRKGVAQNRYVAVEMLETLSHSNIVNLISSQGMLPEEETLETIRKRLSRSSDDDGIIEESDLSIDLADPFSATIFKVPARGVECTHMECFDLETWLNTRPSKPPVKCPHGQVQCACPNMPEPSNPDKWRCPICSKDARPYSLCIDGFLLKVRAQLEEENKLHTKSMRVKADGTWTVVLEADDDGAASDGEDGPGPSIKGKAPAPVSTARRQEVEIIEID
ncbi:hypothetical protein VTK56DRAFT_6591 [Thermocarpiscus australiensis]